MNTLRTPRLHGLPGRAGGANAGAGRIEAAEDEIAFEGAMVVTPADATLVRHMQACSRVAVERIGLRNASPISTLVRHVRVSSSAHVLPELCNPPRHSMMHLQLCSHVYTCSCLAAGRRPP